MRLLLLALIAQPLQAQTAKITVSPLSTTIEAGKLKQLSRTVTVVWASSDTSIATVNQTGWVTAKKPGIVKITVSAGPTLIATSTVTVKPAPPTALLTTAVRPVYATIRGVTTLQWTAYDTVITLGVTKTSWSCPVYPAGSLYGPRPPLCDKQVPAYLIYPYVQ